MVCRLLCAHLASSRGLGCGEYWKMTGAPLKPATGGDTSIPALSLPAVLSPCLTTDSCCPSLWGLSALGEGNNEEAVPCPRPPPRKCQGLPPPHRHPALRTLEAIRGCLVCLVLSCVCVRSPSAFSVSFVSSLLSFPPAPAPTPEFSTGKRVTPPSLPPGSPTHSCFLLFYVRVCIIYFFLPPLFCPPSLPLLPCNWRMSNEFANSWTVRLLCSPMFLLCLPSSSSLPTLSFLQCFLRAVSTIWKLERN